VVINSYLPFSAFSVHRVINVLLICQQNTFIGFYQFPSRINCELHKHIKISNAINLLDRTSKDSVERDIPCFCIYFSISTGKKFPTSLVLCYILNQQNSLHFPYKYQRFYPAPIVLSFFHHSNLQTTKLRNNKKAQTNRVTMEGAGRKHFFVVLIVLATMMLVTEAQIAPTPAPTSAPAPTEVSGGITTVPAFGAAATAVMLLFGYLF
jgi:hypothetical protein